jgi:hypothetical protein
LTGILAHFMHNMFRKEMFIQFINTYFESQKRTM